MPPLEVPAELKTRYDEWAWSVAWSHAPDSTTWKLQHADGRANFLKLKLVPPAAAIALEVERTRWAHPYLPVAAVLDAGSSYGVDWMLTAALPGCDATNAALTERPAEIIRLLAAGLRQFHTAPVDACPFDARVEAMLDHARVQIEAGEIDGAAFHQEAHGHLTPETALAELRRTRPSDQDLVVCHGDYCFPNVLVEDWRVAGFVDLGALGVADRWHDLAIATWSVTWNLGNGWEDLFLEEYGVSRDAERIAFYRLLYEFR